MTIAYIRTYSNKQQTESQKNAIEQLGLFLRLKANLFLPVRKKH